MRSLKEALGDIEDLNLEQKAGFLDGLLRDAIVASKTLTELQRRFAEIENRFLGEPSRLSESLRETKFLWSLKRNSTTVSRDKETFDALLNPIADTERTFLDVHLKAMVYGMNMANDIRKMFAQAALPIALIEPLAKLSRPSDKTALATEVTMAVVGIVPGVGVLAFLIDALGAIRGHLAAHVRITDAVPVIRGLLSCRWYLDYLNEEGLPQIRLALNHVTAEYEKIASLLAMGWASDAKFRAGLNETG